MQTRNFTSPSGRAWTAMIIPRPRMLPGDPTVHVLRFESGQVALDLVDWPSDWHTLDDTALIELARRAMPPGSGLPTDSRPAVPQVAHRETR